jgi:hypothetical protein
MAYNYLQFKGRINAGIKGKIGMLVNARETINAAIREVVSDCDLRTTRRRVLLSPVLSDDTFDYVAVADLKDYGIINLIPDSNSVRSDLRLVPSEEIRRRREVGTMAIEDNDLGRTILIASNNSNAGGIGYDVQYYSKFPWYIEDPNDPDEIIRKENSEEGEYFLVLDSTEFDMAVQKGIELAGGEVDEFDASDRAAKKYEQMKKRYYMNNPSEAMSIISTYADFIKM